LKGRGVVKSFLKEKYIIFAITEVKRVKKHYFSQNILLQYSGVIFGPVWGGDTFGDLFYRAAGKKILKMLFFKAENSQKITVFMKILKKIVEL
jgi:hypothetical protein